MDAQGNGSVGIDPRSVVATFRRTAGNDAADALDRALGADPTLAGDSRGLLTALAERMRGRDAGDVADAMYRLASLVRGGRISEGSHASGDVVEIDPAKNFDDEWRAASGRGTNMPVGGGAYRFSMHMMASGRDRYKVRDVPRGGKGFAMIARDGEEDFAVPISVLRRVAG